MELAEYVGLTLSDPAEYFVPRELDTSDAEASRTVKCHYLNHHVFANGDRYYYSLLRCYCPIDYELL